MTPTQEQDRFQLTKLWGLRRTKSNYWTIQYRGMDWLKIEEFLAGCGNSVLDEEMEKFVAALTAAAGVDEFKYCSAECSPQRGHSQSCSKFTAAAGVGDSGKEMKETERLWDVEAATIERCAQVADRFIGMEGCVGLSIANEIRGLKDKP